MAKAADTIASSTTQGSEQPLLPITALLSDHELRRAMLHWGRYRLLLTIGVVGVLLLAWDLVGRPASTFGVLWAVWLVNLFRRPRRGRASSAPARFYLGEPAEIALVVLLAVVALGLWLTALSGESAAVLGLVAVALVVKIAACRWEPSKNPADYR
jgi:hypothetical protein